MYIVVSLVWKPSTLIVDSSRMRSAGALERTRDKVQHRKKAAMWDDADTGEVLE
ncbi:hypothetical protein H8703_06945 [Bifidobacterium faecale]|uniref:hypothetical protein n=1 Tax=Bifidobacterium adolescentis TaxID=1680 RepID=UPI00165A0BDB|nr:hypothetical protein [Bifidobacterium faecale]